MAGAGGGGGAGFGVGVAVGLGLTGVRVGDGVNLGAPPATASREVSSEVQTSAVTKTARMARMATRTSDDLLAQHAVSWNCRRDDTRFAMFVTDGSPPR
jgi:hypothetical protein